MESGRLGGVEPGRGLMFKQSKWQYLFWLLAGGLLIWVILQTPFNELKAILEQLSLSQIILLIAVNTMIVFLLGMRWWLFLRAFGYPIPYFKITQYRLISFSISYITPGPQFGGEPFQIHLLSTRHDVPTDVNIAALSLDKLMELLANFSILIFGVALTINSGILGGDSQPLAILYAAGLLAIPGIYYVLLRQGKRPLSSLVWTFTKSRKFLYWILPAERRMQKLLKNDPGIFVAAGIISLIIWIALIFEYWLMLYFLGAPLDFIQIIAVITTARVAMLTPLPGALGALELGQTWLMGTLGFPASLGIAISLLVRGRDILFSLIGLTWYKVSLESYKNS